MRVAILGAVSKPGFYDMPTEAPVSDVVTKAGGPVADSRLNKMRLERADNTLIASDSLRKALDAGATLSQIGVQSGDRFIVPIGGGLQRTLGVLGAIIAIPISIYYLTTIRR
jgi:protein involved in polysaccharide export with SLBB domain